MLVPTNLARFLGRKKFFEKGLNFMLPCEGTAEPKPATIVI